MSACGVCRTDLHIVDGELTEPKLPLVPGHQIVARVAGGRRALPGRRPRGRAVARLDLDGDCRYCRSGRENLCDRAIFTGYTRDGGYAELAVADERFCFPIPGATRTFRRRRCSAPGLIGYRALRLAGDGERLGLYGFGAAAHIICQVARHQGRRVFAFTRADDGEAQAFALELGAEWAGDALGPAPEELDAALIFAPAGELVPPALRALAKGGTVVCAGIHMSDIPSFPYELLWEERVLRSVANLTREDGEQFLALAPSVPVRTEVETLPARQANEALARAAGGGAARGGGAGAVARRLTGQPHAPATAASRRCGGSPTGRRPPPARRSDARPCRSGWCAPPRVRRPLRSRQARQSTTPSLFE